MNQIDYKKYFEGKKVTKQGFGILGRGLGVVRFLLEAGAEVLVTDIKEESNFKEQIEELKVFCKENNLDFKKVSFRLGEHRLEDFENCDFVIAASGATKDNAYLNHARQKNIPVHQESSLFAEIVRNFNDQILRDSEEKSILKNEDTIKIVGITGTRGKTTTTFLIKELLDEYKKGSTNQVYFGGNVQGVATLENLKNLKAGDWVVMELDSWVLQGFGEIKFSPHIAVFTTFMPDHMNYYKNDLKEYFLDKANIFLYQRADDFLITTEAVNRNIDEYVQVKSVGQKVVVRDVEMQGDAQKYKTKLLGKHNQIPVSLALQVAKVIGMDDDSARKVVENFKGVKGRLELVKEIDGVRFYNDTTATTGDAAVAALEAVRGLLQEENEGGKIVFITGGRDKELDMTKYLNMIQEMSDQQFFKKIIFLQDETTTGTNRVLKEKEENKGKYALEYVAAASIEQAVELAKNTVNKGDVVLFSPGFASFGMFKNEYDRGEKFDKAVNEYF